MHHTFSQPKYHKLEKITKNPEEWLCKKAVTVLVDKQQEEVDGKTVSSWHRPHQWSCVG